MENEIKIKFNGSGNIKIQTLTDFLNKYEDLLYQINNKLGYTPEDLLIEVSPPANGSFKINLSPKYENALLKTVGTIVASTLSGLIVYHMTKPIKPATTNEIEMLLEEKGITDKEISKNVYNIYHNSGANQTINQTFQIVDSDEKITGLKIQQDSLNIIDIPKDKMKEYITDTSSIDLTKAAKEDNLTEEAILIVKTIHFEGNAKWAFIYRGYPIKAIVKDKEFLQKLSSEAFRKGDTMKVILTRKRHFDEELGTYLVDQSSYVIEKVLEHTSKTDSSQNKLDF
ncbi:hypothetical protein MATR_19510 [Marivirga tractuosa]|uniref:Uncharacterized protein n=1 Tax=Marivirga tractuosa (strain ATCC 23168 / DSM 4126 / NBRC 15989 / NCIMB 1408 / VKM B-1430 / H-43) TaxID=643867 RepID=E4TNH2_MARTH|nr:hypothetical protein [Marivirga tractuosa]ADR20429.1 hypothetical protein Ftrac_0423 [Marivirga tractuosa DSM 4126]BDD15126.1 hypothetical protein MATR_19510 [Marivirga tractuosa]